MSKHATDSAVRSVIPIVSRPIDGLSPIFMKAAAGYPPWGDEDAQAVIDFTDRSGDVFERKQILGAKVTSYQVSAGVEYDAIVTSRAKW